MALTRTKIEEKPPPAQPDAGCSMLDAGSTFHPVGRLWRRRPACTDDRRTKINDRKPSPTDVDILGPGRVGDLRSSFFVL
jgi:hypothetical protein